jgi:alpha-tubulin suppressor-like RCC1 family protein
MLAIAALSMAVPGEAWAQSWLRYRGAGTTTPSFCGVGGDRIDPAELVAVNLNGDILLLGTGLALNGVRRGWGLNTWGVYGWLPSNPPAEDCVDFPSPEGPWRSYHTQVAFGPTHAAAIASGIFGNQFVGASVVCWGSNAHGQCNVPPEPWGGPIGTVLEVACWSHHTMARNGSGQVRVWGGNAYGQCEVPASVGTGNPGAVQIAAGAFHSIALRADGSLTCWGAGAPTDPVDNAYLCGQSNPPAGLGPVASVAAGGFHTVALRTDGSVRCFGAGNTVQTWNQNLRQSLVPPDLGPCTRIAAGAYSTVALTIEGTVRAWGYVQGDGYCTGQCDFPPGFGNVQDLWAGYRGMVVLTDQPRPECPADLEPSCNVDGADLGALLAAWGPQPGGSPADLDDDGAVDGLDLGMLLAAWGSCAD